MSTRLSKGDMVIIRSSKDPLLSKVFDLPEAIYGIVVQCRYKRDIYLLSPVNNPYVSSPYWVEGKHLDRVEQAWQEYGERYKIVNDHPVPTLPLDEKK